MSHCLYIALLYYKYSTIPDPTLKRQYYNKFTEKEFLNKPVITLTPWDSVKKGAVVTVKCAVEGINCTATFLLIYTKSTDILANDDERN